MKMEGQITVFLSLVLLLVLGVAGAALEHARIAGTRAMLQLQSSSALESVFAAYSLELAEQYGLLFFSGGETGVQEQFSAYLGYETNPDQNTLFAGRYYAYPFDVHAVQAERLVRATDLGGICFVDSALAHFKYVNAAAMVAALLEKLEILGLGIDASADMDAYDDLFTETDWGHEAPPEDGAEDTPGGNYTNEEIQESLWDSGIHVVEQFLGSGIWKIVKPRDAVLSGLTIAQEHLPSLAAQSAVPDGKPGVDLLGSPVRTLLFNEYMMSVCNHYTTQLQEGGMQYEIEYVIAGQDSDAENLYAVLNRLAALREGMNLLYLLGDAGKQNEAFLMASGLIGWTMNPALVEVVKYLLLAGWAYAESLSDVHQLLEGGRVPLVKTADSWRFQLSHLADLRAEDMAEGTEQAGLDYADYLRVLLAMTDGQSRCYRMMDVIQLRMQLQNADFQMTQCIYDAKLQIEGDSVGRWPTTLRLTTSYSY